MAGGQRTRGGGAKGREKRGQGGGKGRDNDEEDKREGATRMNGQQKTRTHEQVIPFLLCTGLGHLDVPRLCEFPCGLVLFREDLARLEGLNHLLASRWDVVEAGRLEDGIGLAGGIEAELLLLLVEVVREHG